MKALTVRVLLVAMSVAGCASLPKPVTPHTQGTTALRALHALKSYVFTWTAEADVDQFLKGKRVRGQVMMLVERPDRMRVDALTQFGPMAILTTQQGQFALTDLRDRRYVLGPMCKEHVQAVLGVPVEMRELLPLLWGDIAEFPVQKDSIEWDDNGYYNVRLTTATGRWILFLGLRPGDDLVSPAEQHLRLLYVRREDQMGKALWTLTYDDYRVVEARVPGLEPVRGVALPHTIHWVDESSGRDVLFKIRNVTLNQKIPPHAFVQKPRSGLRFFLASCTK